MIDQGRRGQTGPSGQPGIPGPQGPQVRTVDYVSLSMHVIFEEYHSFVGSCNTHMAAGS